MDWQSQQPELDRQLADLAPRLAGPAPRPEHLATIRNAVAAEARRLHRLAALRPWIGAAAAVLLTVGLSLPFGTGTRYPAALRDASPEAVFNDWVAALDDSGRQFAGLLESDWLLAPADSGAEENGDGSDPLESLEESLQSFEHMIGA
jgi:hypothetical protein